MLSLQLLNILLVFLHRLGFVLMLVKIKVVLANKLITESTPQLQERRRVDTRGEKLLGTAAGAACLVWLINRLCHYPEELNNWGHILG